MNLLRELARRLRMPIGVRLALGASRLRLVRQPLAESVLLSGSGAPWKISAKTCVPLPRNASTVGFAGEAMKCENSPQATLGRLSAPRMGVLI